MNSVIKKLLLPLSAVNFRSGFLTGHLFTEHLGEEELRNNFEDKNTLRYLRRRLVRTYVRIEERLFFFKMKITFLFL